MPMLFLQGTRDMLADTTLVEATVASPGPRTTLALVADGGHSFHVRARSGRTDAEATAWMLDRVAKWTDRTLDEGR